MRDKQKNKILLCRNNNVENCVYQEFISLMFTHYVYRYYVAANVIVIPSRDRDSMTRFS